MRTSKLDFQQSLSKVEWAMIATGDGEPSDIHWSKATFVPAQAKQPISIRLDADILDFFRSQGGGYQGRINRVLRHYMESVKKTG